MQCRAGGIQGASCRTRSVRTQADQQTCVTATSLTRSQRRKHGQPSHSVVKGQPSECWHVSTQTWGALGRYAWQDPRLCRAAGGHEVTVHLLTWKAGALYGPLQRASLSRRPLGGEVGVAGWRAQRGEEEPRGSSPKQQGGWLRGDLEGGQGD